MPKYNILHVYPQLNCGGTEMVIYNLIKFSDHEQFSFSILVQKTGEQDKAFEEIGCKITTIPLPDLKDTDCYYQELVSYFDENHFTAIHTHMHNEMGLVLRAARAADVRHRIAHSHNARVDFPKFLWPLRFFKHHRFEKYATDLFGCSESALRWLFPLRWKEGKVIYNAIDLSAFSFSESKRNLLRAKLGAADSTKVVINVGRCTNQKNQFFILDRAKELIKENLMFIIIGEGPLLNDLKNRIREDNLHNVLLLGKRLDVADWLSAADMFIFPSVYEGLGIVAIEAQATGLPVIATDTIPMEADMGLCLFHRIPLSNTEDWNLKLCSLSSSDNRADISKRALISHYNILTVAKEVNEVYLR